MIQFIRTRWLLHPTRTVYIGLVHRWLLFCEQSETDGFQPVFSCLKEDCGGQVPKNIKAVEFGEARREMNQFNLEFAEIEPLKPFHPGIFLKLWAFLLYLVFERRKVPIKWKNVFFLKFRIGPGVEEGRYFLKAGSGSGGSYRIYLTHPRRFRMFLPWNSGTRSAVFFACLVFCSLLNPLEYIFLVIKSDPDWINNPLFLTNVMFWVTFFFTGFTMALEVALMSAKDMPLSILDDLLVVIIGGFLCWFGKMAVLFTVYGVSGGKLDKIEAAVKKSPFFFESLLSKLLGG